MRILSLLLIIFALTLPVSAQAEYKQSPYFDAAVASGDLPPIEARLPEEPNVVNLAARGQEAGRHGGKLVTLMAKDKDTRYIYAYGYARLVKYNEKLDLVPDILKAFEVSDGGRTFTFHLRKGHKWSDGKPFTTDDFLFYWEDIAHNPDLSPSGPPAHLQIMGQLPVVEVVDETTIIYHFPVPNPDFLPGLAQARPNQIFAPKHYLKKYHPRYKPLEELEAKAADAGQRNWAAVFLKKNRYYRMTNPKLPTLQPWIATTKAPADRFIFTRNPYYHKVDVNGLQLPYVDEVIVNISEAKLIAGKAATGDVDFQGRYLRFEDVTLLKRNEDKHGFQTFLWRIAKGSHAAIFPNLTHKDPVYRAMVRDPRFRQALSLAVNRREINRVIYFGQALEAQNTMLPQSPLFREEFQKAYTKYDIKAANALLDEMGLKRGWDGTRYRPDGQPIEIIVETNGSTEHADILELITDSWWNLGIKVFIKPLGKDTLRRRIFSGQTMMTVDSGFENGLATPDMAPNDLAPISQVQYEWSEWGEYFETNGNNGSPPDMEIGKRLMALREEWYRSETMADKARIWEEMLRIHAENLPSIGLVSGVLQPIVVKDGVMNLPKEGLWNWDPGAHFGLYGLDCVFWAEGATADSAPHAAQ